MKLSGEAGFEDATEASYAYTPGLKVKSSLRIARTRKLPIKGDVLVREGDSVDFDTIVARADISGYPQIIPVSELLDILEEDVSEYMLKKIGDKVSKDDVIAMKSSFFGLSKNLVKSPCDGVVESVSELTGQVIVREPEIEVNISAYIPGKVDQVLPDLGVVIETQAAFIQGIFGIGPENHGELVVLVDSPDDTSTAEMITVEHEGKILVVGAKVTKDVIRKATEVGAVGVISGSIDSPDLTSLLGYEIGVAITGHEDIGITLITTEGFGRMRISDRTFALLKSLNNRMAAINGATQIRAGVLRPEIIIPAALEENELEEAELDAGMRIGTPIRIIRAPHFGEFGTVVDFPVALRKIETESYVRVVEVKLTSGEHVTVPRANVEIIEE